MYVHVPEKKVLGFHQILYNAFHPYKRLGITAGEKHLRRPLEDPMTRKKQTCENVGQVGERTRESKAKLIWVTKRWSREFGEINKRRETFKQVHEEDRGGKRIFKRLLRGSSPQDAPENKQFSCCCFG